MSSLKYKTEWNGHTISMEAKMFGGWPGLGILGGSDHHSLEVDGQRVAHHEGSQAGNILNGLFGKRMELAGTFKGSDGASHRVSVWFPWSTPYCVVTTDNNEPIRVTVTI